MAKKESVTWMVAHPGHCTVPVIAENWERATVEAASFWGVPWASVAAGCEMAGKKPTTRNICQRCGRMMSGRTGICEACEKILRTEDEITGKKMMKTWYMGRRDAAFGG